MPNAIHISPPRLNRLPWPRKRHTEDQGIAAVANADAVPSCAAKTSRVAQTACVFSGIQGCEK